MGKYQQTRGSIGIFDANWDTKYAVIDIVHGKHLMRHAGCPSVRCDRAAKKIYAPGVCRTGAASIKLNQQCSPRADAGFVRA